MVNWISVYEEAATNAQINSGGTNFETFLSNNNARANMLRHQQSFNSLEINNDSSNCVLDIDLDGLSTRRRRLFAKTSLIIEPKDGIFFNTIKVINTSAANNLTAGDLKINARIVKPLME